VLPCVTNIVVYGNDVRVRGRNGRRKKHAARTHAARTHARTPTAPTTAAHRILCQVKNGSLDIVLHKITLIWCLQTDKIWY
jgi:hypothetical protein